MNKYKVTITGFGNTLTKIFKSSLHEKTSGIDQTRQEFYELFGELAKIEKVNVTEIN